MTLVALFFLFTQHVITHISLRVAIIALGLIILTNCLRLAKVLAMENKLMLRRWFFSKNFQNNGKITVIVGSSHLDVFRKKVEKLPMHIQRKSL